MKDPSGGWHRRSWLVAMVRYLVLAGIGLLSWHLVRRSDGVCWQASLPCRDCGLLAHCSLPRARNAKNQQQSSLDADEVRS